jgi:DNA polymerase elongation subunit (family B)
MSSKFISGEFFSYYWYVDEKQTEVTSIRAYGLDENNKNICLRIDDFTPYIYLELPEKTSNGYTIDWKSKVLSLGSRLDEILKNNTPIKKTLQYKHKLYGARIDKNGNKEVFPYLLCTFSNRADYKNLYYILKKPIYILGLGQINLKMHEQDASEVLQLVSCRDIPTAGWIKFIGKEVKEDDKLTLCDKEYMVSYRQLNKLDKNILACPKIMGFDIEVNSTNPSAMPQASKPGDKIFQISCVFSREGEGEENYDIYLLTLGEVDPELLGDNVSAYMYESEADLLEGFTELVREENPNIIVGYNILKFDIQYMIDRAKSSATHFCFNDFSKLGFHVENQSEQKKIKWSSSAFKNQEFDYLDAEGRVFVDLLPLIQRDYKFNNYQLKTVSKEILNDTKDDLSPKGIFKCYRIGIQKEKDGTYSKKAVKAMSLCGKYCLKDSILVVKLMDKLQAWVGLAEMAKTTNISIFDVFTQGQQKKVYSQIYKYCMYQNIVVEKDAYVTKENERYVGAHVFPPIAGNYERVLPFDFCLTGDTLVTLSNGTSKRIDQMQKEDLVLGFNEKGFQNFKFINGLQKKGLKETIKLHLEDGRTISCTPEHKFMLCDKSWCEAKNLKDKDVMCGIEYPEDISYDNEKYWSLEVDGYIFNMKNEVEREKTMAFSRMLGYILSDGSIYLSNIIEGFCVYCNKLVNSNSALNIHYKSKSCKKNQEYFKEKTIEEIKEYYENKDRIKSNLTPDKRFKKNGGSDIKRPINLYQIFTKIEYEKILLENSQLKNTDIFKEIAIRWNLIKDDEKELEKYRIALPKNQDVYSKSNEKIFRKNNKSCYLIFMVDEIKKIKLEFPGIKVKEINKELSHRWKLIKNNKDIIDSLKEKIKNSNYIKKDNNNIEKPKSGYWFYYKNEVDNIKKINPSLSNKEIVNLSYQLWNKLKIDKTNKYQIMSNNDKFEYKKKINEYIPNVVITPKINIQEKSEACFGTLIDAENFKKDLMKIFNIDITIRKRETDDLERKKKGITFSLNIPYSVSKMFHSLEDIVVGKRSTQNMKLPKFLLNKNCPNSIIKSFLGGLYGGDGSCPSLSSNSFSNIRFKWTTIEKCIDSMKETFENLKFLHEKIGINVKVHDPYLITYKKNSIKPKDYLENKRYDIYLSVLTKDTLKFNKEIGFIYCVNKNYKLNLASSFKTFHSINKKINSKYYIKNIGVENWFKPKQYIIKRDDIFIPSYKQKIIKIEKNGLQEVYDIEVENVHNFLANGIVSHNCSLYPTT